MKVEVDAGELAKLREEVERLRAREGELLESNTRLVNEARTAKHRLQAVTRWFATEQRQADVIDFFGVAGQEVGASPSHPRDADVRLGLELCVEEVFECLEAAFANRWKADNPHEVPPHDWMKTLLGALMIAIRELFVVDIDMPALVDGLTDTDYVVEGMRVRLGVDGRPIWRGVHEANMAKAGGPKDPVTGKKLKPPGWQPFDVAAELRRQGWAG